MLGEVTSEELTEWQAYFKVKEKFYVEQEKQAKAKAKAAKQGR